MACMVRTWIRSMTPEARAGLGNPRSPKARLVAPDHLIKQKAGGHFDKTIGRRRRAARIVRLGRRANRR